MLKLIIVPLLMCQVFAVAAKNGIHTGKTIWKTVLLFIVLFAITFVLCAVILQWIQPGYGYTLPADEWTGSVADTGANSILSNLFCWNIFEAMAAGKILPCILFSLICGIAASVLHFEKAAEAADKASAVFTKILDWIMYLTPVGVFALLANAAAANGIGLIGISLKYILFAWGLSIVVLLLVMYLPLLIFRKITPLRYIRAMFRVWSVSLSTCSSAATLPTTIQVCREEFKIPDRITSIVVPLGCTIHMCGGAVSFCLLAMFTMQASGIGMSISMFFAMLLLAELLNMAAPGIPGGGIALGAAYLSGLGLPLGFLGIYSGIYRFLDMTYTTLNVTGDVTANILLSNEQEQKDA